MQNITTVPALSVPSTRRGLHFGLWSAQVLVAGVFLLAGEVAPKGTRYTMWTCLAVQVAVGLAGAIVRSSTDGRAGSVLAFGVLVPMLGIGTNGAWAARYGSYGPRVQAARPTGGRRGR